MRRLLLAAILIAPMPAYAVVIYDWLGDCTSGCAGSASATLTLLNTYTPGTLLSNADFSSFSYTSSSGSFVIPGDESFLGFFGGSALPAVSGAAGDFVMDFGSFGTIFCAPDSLGIISICAATPQWHMIFQPLAIDDIGRDAGIWTLSVPEPGTLGLLGAGLIGLLLRRKRVA